MLLFFNFYRLMDKRIKSAVVSERIFRSLLADPWHKVHYAIKRFCKRRMPVLLDRMEADLPSREQALPGASGQRSTKSSSSMQKFVFREARLLAVRLQPERILCLCRRFDVTGGSLFFKFWCSCTSLKLLLPYGTRKSKNACLTMWLVSRFLWVSLFRVGLWSFMIDGRKGENEVHIGNNLM